MPLLHTALQEGFEDDEVLLRIGGRDVFHQPHVQTRRQVGLAATYEAQVPMGPVRVEALLPKRQLAATVSLQITQNTYLGMSVSPEGRIEHVVTHEPFGYA